LLRRVPGKFHGRVPGPVWPDEDSHSPWTSFRGPRHSITANTSLVRRRRNRSSGWWLNYSCALPHYVPTSNQHLLVGAGAESFVIYPAVVLCDVPLREGAEPAIPPYLREIGLD